MKLAKVLNICPTNPSEVQFPMAIIPPGLHTRNNSSRHNFRPRRKHCSNQARDHVKTAIFKRQIFGIAFDETSVEILRLGARLRTSDEIRSDVYAGGVHSIPRCPKRYLARTASHIEQLASRGNIELFIKNPRAVFHIAREPVVVSRHPGLFEPRFQSGNSGAIVVVLISSSCVLVSPLGVILAAKDCATIFPSRTTNVSVAAS